MCILSLPPFVRKYKIDSDPQKIRSIAVIYLASQFRSHMQRFIMQHVFALANMPLCCGFIELSATMGTLNIVAGITGWRWWQVGGIYSFRYRCLILLGRTDRIDEIFVFAPPIGFHLWFFCCLKQCENISVFIFLLCLAYLLNCTGKKKKNI